MNIDDFPPPSADPIVLEAYELCRTGRWSDALRVSSEKQNDCRDEVNLNMVRAMAMKSTARQRDAIDVLMTVLELEPDRTDLMTLVGMCHRDLGERERALSFNRRVLEIDNSDAKARYQLAVILQEIGRHGEAAEAFARYLADDVGKTNALAWSLFGVVLRNLKRFDASIKAIEKSIKLNPEDIPTRNALVITHYHAENMTAATDAGREALILKDHAATASFAALQNAPSITLRNVPFDPTKKDRNIISFSLWGDDPVYTHGAIVNAQLGPHVYPGWKCRFYCDDTVPEPIRHELKRLGAEVQMVTDKELHKLKPLWRFLASDDPKIDRFICRDADSRLNTHEAVAVDAWVKSGLPFHVMRDHIYHMEVILAGMWGGVARVLPNIRELLSLALDYQANKWNDQEFLRDIVWPLIRNHTKAHDSIFQFRGACDFPEVCRLPGKVHVGGAIKRMSEWPVGQNSQNSGENGL